jgi:uncharacterized Tic20 family protein
MSFNPQQSNSGRPMPPNYGQPSGTQQPYTQRPYTHRTGFGESQPFFNPALFDSRNLPDSAYGPGSERFWMADERDRTTAMWSHLGTLLFGYLPLIMFLVKKDESPFVREHTRQGLNAMITNTIATTAALFILGFFGFALAFVTFGLGMFIMFAAFVVPVLYTVLYIIAGIAAHRGEGNRIPLVFEFVR